LHLSEIKHQYRIICVALHDHHLYRALIVIGDTKNKNSHVVTYWIKF